MASLTNKTLLIIGAGREQVKAYEQAKNMGLTVVGTDMNQNAPAFELADHSLICSTRDVNGTVNTVLEFANNHKIDGVMTIANDVPLTVATVAKELDLPSLSIDSATKLVDKRLMKKCFINNKVSTPIYSIVKEFIDIDVFIKEHGYPVILKPIDGRGSKGVLYLEKNSDLNWAFLYSMSNSDKKTLIIEVFEDGPQLSVESVYINGKYIPVAFADRNYSKLNEYKPFIIEDGGLIHSRFSDDILEQVSNCVKKATHAIGIDWGTVKADVVLTNDGPKIIELAGRLSGGYLSTHHIPIVYGVNLVKVVIKLSLGIYVSKEEVMTKHRKYLGVRYFFAKPGFVREFELPDVRRKDIEIETYLKIGDYFPKVTNSDCTAGFVLALSDNYSQAEKKAIEIVKKTKIVTGPKYCVF